MKYSFSILIALSLIITTGCTTNNNYITYYSPPQFTVAPVLEKSTGDTNISKTKELFIYFIAPVNDGTIAKLIEGIDKKIAIHDIKTIHLFLNSSGGSTVSGIAAYNYLKNIDVTLKTYNLSRVSSSATYLYCAGDERYSTTGSSFIFHNITVNLPQMDMDEVVLRGETMQNEKGSLISIYNECLNNNDKIIKSIFSGGYFVVSPDDLDIGLSSETIKSIPRPGKYTLFL